MISPHRPPDVYGDLRLGTDVVRAASLVLQELMKDDRDRYHPEAIENMRALGHTLIQAGEGVITACNLTLNPYQGTLFDADNVNPVENIAPPNAQTDEHDSEEFDLDNEEAA